MIYATSLLLWFNLLTNISSNLKENLLCLTYSLYLIDFILLLITLLIYWLCLLLIDLCLPWLSFPCAQLEYILIVLKIVRIIYAIFVHTCDLYKALKFVGV